MAIPDYQTVMLPYLKWVSDGAVHRTRDMPDALATEFRLTQEEMAKRIPSGQLTVFESRVGWARTYLKKAGLIVAVARGEYQITPRGIEVLRSNPSKIDNALLRQFPEFLEFVGGKDDSPQDENIEVPELPEKQTPVEALESAYRQLNRELADELLQMLRSATPAFFERLVVDLLVAMGYGGSRKDAGKAVGKSGDDGVDGIIKEDRLGLDAVYIQAKRWAAVVGRPEI